MNRILAVAALLLVVVACGGEDPKSDPAPLQTTTNAPEAAEPEIAQEPPADPVRDLEKEGVHLLRNGKAEEALTRFEAVLERDPDSPVAHRHLASIHLAAGRRNEASTHLRKAVRLPERTFGRPGDVINGREYADLAVDLWLDRPAEAPDELLLLEEAIVADPENARAAMILSDIHGGTGAGPKRALAILEEAGRALPTTEDGASLLLRLAVRRFLSGDVEGFQAALARIPKDTGARRTADQLGEPELPWGVSVEGRPSSRPGRLEAWVDGLAFTADELNPGEAIAAGHPVVLARLVAGPLVPEMRTVVLWAYLPGLDAYLTDDVTLREPHVIPAAVVRQGLIYVLTEAAAESATSKAHGGAIDAAFDALAEGNVAEAWDGLDGHMDHPLARYVRARIAIVRGAGADAAALILGVEKKAPPGAAWSLAYGEALLAKGEVGRALQVLRRSEKTEGLPKDHVLTRRVEALTKIKTDDDSEAVALLTKLVEDRPDYAAAWEDLAGLHLAAERHVEGREVLVGLAAAIPGFEELPRYLIARRKAVAGMILGARTAEVLMLLDGTDEPELRRIAVRAAGRLSLDERRKSLHYFLKDPDVKVRVLSLRLLAMDAWAGSEEPVRLCLEAEEPNVRGEATRTYCRIAGRASANRLVDLLADDSSYVREVAVQQLRALSGKMHGFDPEGPEDERDAAAAKWDGWARSLD